MPLDPRITDTTNVPEFRALTDALASAVGVHPSVLNEMRTNLTDGGPAKQVEEFKVVGEFNRQEWVLTDPWHRSASWTHKAVLCLIEVEREAARATRRAAGENV